MAVIKLLHTILRGKLVVADETINSINIGTKPTQYPPQNSCLLRTAFKKGVEIIKLSQFILTRYRDWSGLLLHGNV